MKKSEKLKRIQTAIDYTLRTPEAQKALNKLSFPKSEMLQGRALLEHVRMLDTAQRKEYGDQHQATDELRRARQQARQQYIKHVAAARFALKDHRGYWTTLELAGERKRDLFGWLAQAHTFYGNVEPVKAILAQYNLTEEELQQGKSMIEAVIEAYNVRQKESNEAQTATQQRDEVMSQLHDWMRRFSQTARLAFAHDPQILKGMGLVSKVTV